ncbi:MAG: DHHW family protein, partial [Eubacteriales bacterium]
MKKLTSLLTITLFCAILFSFGLAAVLLPDTEISTAERRLLTQFPTLTWKTVADGAFVQNLEKYLPDQFPLREGFRGLKAVFEKLTLRLDNNGIYEYRGHLASLDDQLNENLVEKAAAKLNVVQNALLADGHTAYLALVPPKNFFIDDEHPVMDYEKLRSMMWERCPDFTAIDLFDVLTLDDYYKTDSHWRQERLASVVERLTDGMGVGEYRTDAYETHELLNFKGVYAGQSALPVRAETMYYLTNDAIDNAEVNYIAAEVADNGVYALSKADGVDMYDIFLGGAVPVVEITNKLAPNDKELVIFRDSYGSSLAPLLMECYRKITLVDLRYIALEFVPQFVST